MKNHDKLYFWGLALIFVLSGCVVRSYPLTRERVDQDTDGNRGYLQGQAPESSEVKDKKLTRTTQVVEMEFQPLIKFERGPKKTVAKSETQVSEEPLEDTSMWGNRGYITQTNVPEESETKIRLEKYTVKKGDTLQKISRQYYGTTKKWNKIYQANPQLKGPNRILPGQVIDVPLEAEEGLKEPIENLK